MISDIKKLDSNYNFIKNFVVNNGYPNWKKVISNELFMNHIKIQNLGSDPNVQNQEIPRKVFLIPFTKKSDTISGILACVNEKENFTYKFYDRKRLEILYNSNDTIKNSRENILAIFAFFENFINQRNSTVVEGIYNETFSNVNIDFKSTPQNISSNFNNYQANSGFTGVSYLEVCYKVVANRPITTNYMGVNQQANENNTKQKSNSMSDSRCALIPVYGNNMGTETIGTGLVGSTSSTGSIGGDGGSYGGNNNSYVTYSCPTTIWWCESGDYRLVDGVLFTPDNFPGKETGNPWLWWENPEYNIASWDPVTDQAIIDQINQEDAADDLAYSNNPCGQTGRYGNLMWKGTLEHVMIQFDYINKNSNGYREYKIPFSGQSGLNPGYVDIANTLTNEMFEIKPNNNTGVSEARSEIENYVNKANTYCPPNNTTISPVWIYGTQYSDTYLPNPKDPTTSIHSIFKEPGVITYEYSPRVPLTSVAIPQNIYDKLKLFFRYYAKNVNTLTDKAITTFLKAPSNADILEFIKDNKYKIGLSIVLATLLEDILTYGVGVVDDIPSFIFALRIIRIGLKS